MEAMRGSFVDSSSTWHLFVTKSLRTPLSLQASGCWTSAVETGSSLLPPRMQ